MEILYINIHLVQIAGFPETRTDSYFAIWFILCTTGGDRIEEERKVGGDAGYSRDGRIDWSFSPLLSLSLVR